MEEKQTKEGEEHEEISAKTRWGNFAISGQTTILAMMILGLGALLIFHDSRRQGEHETVMANDQKILSALRINNYLLSLPPEARPRLIPPPEIWKMLDDGKANSNPNPLERGRE